MSLLKRKSTSTVHPINSRVQQRKDLGNRMFCDSKGHVVHYSKQTNKAVRGATSKEAASFAAFFNKPVNVERVNKYQETLAFNKKQKTIISLLSFCVILLLVFVTRNTIESGNLVLGYVLLLLDTIVISLYSVILLEMIKEMIINKFKRNSRW